VLACARGKRTLEGGEGGRVPALDDALVDEVLQLTLGEQRVLEVETAEVLDLGVVREVEVLEEPLVLAIAVVVLVGATGVGHTLDRIHDRARKVVDRVHLVLGSVRPQRGRQHQHVQFLVHTPSSEPPAHAAQEG
jgi:hypothetical protein